jgi:hypothetical protein
MTYSIVFYPLLQPCRCTSDTLGKIKIDNGTAVDAALTIGGKGKLALGATGTITVKSYTSTLVSSGDAAKFVIGTAGTKVELDSTSTGSDATFTIGTGVFANGTGTVGTFISGAVGSYTADDGGFWTKDA